MKRAYFYFVVLYNCTCYDFTPNKLVLSTLFAEKYHVNQIHKNENTTIKYSLFCLGMQLLKYLVEDEVFKGAGYRWEQNTKLARSL